MTVADPIRFVVLDDHPMVGVGIAEALRSSGDLACVGTTDDPEVAEHLLAQGGVDVLLLDVRLGAIDGIALCAVLRERYPETWILIITSIADATLVRRALAAGAGGVAIKSIALDMLPAAVRQVHRHKIFVASELIVSALEDDRTPSIGNSQPAQDLQATAVTVGHGAPQPPESPGALSLTQREEQIVNLVRRGLQNKEIARQLAISPDTVKLHVSRLLKRHGFRSRVQLASLGEAGDGPTVRPR